MVCVQVHRNCAPNKRPANGENSVEHEQTLSKSEESHDEFILKIYTRSDQWVVCKCAETAQYKSEVRKWSKFSGAWPKVNQVWGDRNESMQQIWAQCDKQFFWKCVETSDVTDVRMDRQTRSFLYTPPTSFPRGKNIKVSQMIENCCLTTAMRFHTNKWVIRL